MIGCLWVRVGCLWDGYGILMGFLCSMFFKVSVTTLAPKIMKGSRTNVKAPHVP